MTPPGPLLASLYGLYLLAVITPGPNTFIVTRLALSSTRRRAALAVLGIGLGNTVWLSFVLGGVAVLLQRFPDALRAVRYGGGLYLLYLGARGLYSARKVPPGGSAAGAGEQASGAELERPLRSGLLTSLSNPNTLPFYLSLLAPALTAGTPAWVGVAAAAGIVTLAVSWYGTLAWGLSTGAVRRVYLQRERVIRQVLAGVLLVYGLRLLLTH